MTLMWDCLGPQRVIAAKRPEGLVYASLWGMRASYTRDVPPPVDCPLGMKAHKDMYFSPAIPRSAIPFESVRTEPGLAFVSEMPRTEMSKPIMARLIIPRLVSNRFTERLLLTVP